MKSNDYLINGLHKKDAKEIHTSCVYWIKMVINHDETIIIKLKIELLDDITSR